MNNADYIKHLKETDLRPKLIKNDVIILHEQDADSHWVDTYKDIYQRQEMMYRRTKCSEFKSVWTQKGRDAFQLCSIRAKIHGLQKVNAYLKTVSHKDPQQMLYIKNTIKFYSEQITKMSEYLKNMESKK